MKDKTPTKSDHFVSDEKKAIEVKIEATDSGKDRKPIGGVLPAMKTGASPKEQTGIQGDTGKLSGIASSRVVEPIVIDD